MRARQSSVFLQWLRAFRILLCGLLLRSSRKTTHTYTQLNWKTWLFNKNKFNFIAFSPARFYTYTNRASLYLYKYINVCVYQHNFDVQSSLKKTTTTKSNQNDTTTMCCLWFYFGVYTLKTSNLNALYVHIFLNRLRTVLSNLCNWLSVSLFFSRCAFFAYKINISNEFACMCVCVSVCDWVHERAPHFHIDFSCVIGESFSALHCRAF